MTIQNEYSLLNREIEKDVVPACKQFGLGVLPYFPLASGLLTGKYQRGEKPPADTRLQAWGPRGERMLSDENFDVIEKLDAFAKERGHTLLDMAFGWLISHDFVPSVIAGATKPEQIEANVKATEWKLTPEEMEEVGKLTGPRPTSANETGAPSASREALRLVADDESLERISLPAVDALQRRDLADVVGRVHDREAALMKLRDRLLAHPPKSTSSVPDRRRSNRRCTVVSGRARPSRTP